ncbi:hypothetical protein BDP81DRAFT_401265 [Colletotrichum phormii]|uniref:Uncharacterized protein n=1 Tax=Colletotrichum phormii TaxID=359342 RepID=A0AAI9ZBB6_9PEZI|nr:uncharacterized protein BDP81DRAFT_401265 [Colletotrichum phormii]KAK1613484.1 hypothetical protein BDP81DRAFT_401265 [Colletotrichum phormii]
MEYDVDPDDPDKSDDAQLRFVHMAFDRLVDHAKAVITPSVVTWNALFEVNRTELSKERTKPFHFRFKPETQRRYGLVVKQLLAYFTAYNAVMDHADDLAEAWNEGGRDPDAPGIAGLLDGLEIAVLELYISVLDHFTKDSEYDSVLDLLFFGAFSEQSAAELGLPAIPWAELLDNAADETVGRSLVQDDGLRSRWVTSTNDGGLTLHPMPAYRYGLRVEKALELLAVLVHISSGFPLRAWELLVVRHRNTYNGGIRNIFYDRGLVIVVTGAYKGFTTIGRLKIIYRFLPHEGDETQQGGGRTVQDGAGGDEDDNDDNNGIGRLSALAFGQKLNISSWRHISTAIGRRYFRNASTAHTKLL